MLEIGREPVYGEAQDSILAEAADVLIEEAFADDDGGTTEDPGRGQARGRPTGGRPKGRG